MAAMSSPAPLTSEVLHEFVLEMVDQLAVMAAEHGEMATARALWACWGQINRTVDQPSALDDREAGVGEETVWIDAPRRPRK